ncbi:MAG TPA: class I SAM-dependent methyltransferase [Desulfitobacteriaceae bacterium]|nr:class I SAM-dependent methyltransferase [Desulfitobacteriaceae bacterium]
MADLIKLGLRLNCIASLIPARARLADIGTDHAYLPIALCQQGKIEYAVAVDIHQGPYQSALAAVREHNFENKIAVRLGNGLQTLLPGEIDTLSLAGMGGKTILEILFARQDILAGVSDLVLQPQGWESKVRSALLEAGWLLKEEHLAEDEGRIYMIMAFSRKTGYCKREILEMEKQWIEKILTASKSEKNRDPAAAIFRNDQRETEGGKEITLASSLFWYLGPLILEAPDPILPGLVQEYLKILCKREKQMRKSLSLRVQTRGQEILFQLSLLEVLIQLLNDKGHNGYRIR